MKYYEIYRNNTLIKRYPFKSQAVIWCFLNKYVNSGSGWYFLDPKVEIIESEEV